MEYTKVALRGETKRTALAPKNKQLGIVTTKAVNLEIEETKNFGIFLLQSIVQFNNGDWGQTCEEDKEANDYDLAELKEDRNGRIIASYERDGFRKIWIIRNIVDETGTQKLTVMFPEEY
tara:strand:- start:445 stop:804 length:360 start_codon:yes stop_codon:yes gene_type:complete